MRSLLFWIAVSKVLLVLIILYAGIGLMPDEAQYWTWSKELSYGYYSKPPGIAWQIALGCKLFGDTEFGVRSMSVVLSFFLSLAIFWLAKLATKDEQKAYWAAIVFSFCPLGFLSGFFATTDCTYVLFWTLACALFIKGTSPLKIGLVIAIGALWKWPVYAVWLPIAAFSWRRPGKLILGMLVSLLGLIPSLIWNLEHSFATFQHVAASVDVVGNPGKANPLDFLLAQVGLVSPILFVLLARACILFRSSDRSLRFCWWTFVAFFATIFIASCFEKVQGNWAVASYPTAFVIMVLLSSIFWLRLGTVVGALLLFATLFLTKPFMQGLGWKNISHALLESGYDPHKNFLFSDRYQATSILSFYGPDKTRAYFFNINGLRHNQFDYWPAMKTDCVGKTGYFVEFVLPKDAEAAQKRFQARLEPYFGKVAVLPNRKLYEGKIAIILLCSEYNGAQPMAPNKY